MITENVEIRNLLLSGFKTIHMNRINVNGKRMYVVAEPFRAYSGLTGALSAATFKGHQDEKRLSKWRDKMVDTLGREGQEAYLSSMADFGTLLHECTVKIKEYGGLNWQEEKEYAEAFFEASAKQNGLVPNYGIIRAQVFEYQKAAASVMQWIYDCVTDIYSIEGMCKSDVLGIATPIDMVCKVKEKKSECVVTINLKTSGQLGNHHREQVSVERYLWNETYPELQAQKTGLLRPKDWSVKKGIPTYEFELLDEETERKYFTNAYKRLMLVKEDEQSTYLNFPNNILTFTGETKLGESPKLEVKTLEQIFTENQLINLIN